MRMAQDSRIGKCIARVLLGRNDEKRVKVSKVNQRNANSDRLTKKRKKKKQIVQSAPCACFHQTQRKRTSEKVIALLARCALYTRLTKEWESNCLHKLKEGEEKKEKKEQAKGGGGEKRTRVIDSRFFSSWASVTWILFSSFLSALCLFFSDTMNRPILQRPRSSGSGIFSRLLSI